MHPAAHRRGIGTEDRNRTGTEEPLISLPRHLEHVAQAVEVDVVAEGGILLSANGEDCSEVVDRVDVVLSDDLCIAIGVGHVTHC